MEFDKFIEDIKKDLVKSGLSGLATKDRTKERESIDIFNDYANWQKSQPSKGRWLNKKEFELISQVDDKDIIKIDGWRLSEAYFRNIIKGKDKFNIQGLPDIPDVFARSLFTTNYNNDDYKVILRGYDKFFNINETPFTSWDFLKNNITGPCEITTKENGCIIYATNFNEQSFKLDDRLNKYDRLLVASKNSIGSKEDDIDGILKQLEKLNLDESTNKIDLNNIKIAHHQMGIYWIRKHLKKSENELGNLLKFLKLFDITLVFELCDDQFQEHVLPYPPHESGLYLHGINFNRLELVTWPSEYVTKVANFFGFIPVDYIVKDKIDQVKQFGEECNGIYKNRAIEGFVVRSSNTKHCFFKIKYDYPYLMYREWREITFKYLKANKDSKKKFTFRQRYPLSRAYFKWLQSKTVSDPKLFKNYLDWQGIIESREAFFEDTGYTLDDNFKKEDQVNNEENKKKMIILPVATIGSGKTVVSKCISKIFNFHHIQSDDYKDGNTFCREVLNALKTFDHIIADRNNQTVELREKILTPILEKYPNAIIIPLQWNIDENNYDFSISDYFNFTYHRILQRGNNHQKLTPKGTLEMEKIMWNFINSFESIDSESNLIDNTYHKLISIDLTKPIENQILDKVIPVINEIENPPKLLLSQLPDLNQVGQLLKECLISESNGKEYSLNSKYPLKYIGISLGENILEILKNKLVSHNKDKDISKKAFQFITKSFSNKRFNNDMPSLLHVTLAFNNSKDNELIVQDYLNDEQIKEWIGKGVIVIFDKLIWEENKVMCLSVKEIRYLPKDDSELYGDKIYINNNKKPDALQVTQKYLHATIGTMNDKIKAVESNLMLESIDKGVGANINQILFDSPIIAWGRVRPFYSYEKKK